MMSTHEERELLRRVHGRVSDPALTAATERFERAQRQANTARQHADQADAEMLSAWAALIAECEQTERALDLLDVTAAMAEGRQA